MNNAMTLNFAMGYSLIDITQTNDTSVSTSTSRNQMRNWETLKQVLGLRTQVILLSTPEIIQLNVTNSKFGSKFTSNHTVWTFKFGVEQQAVYSSSTDQFGTLKSDFTNVPVILGLRESATIDIPIFCTDGAATNIYFESIQFW
jgi:hypothetical protein